MIMLYTSTLYVPQSFRSTAYNCIQVTYSSSYLLGVLLFWKKIAPSKLQSISAQYVAIMTRNLLFVIFCVETESNDMSNELNKGRV